VTTEQSKITIHEKHWAGRDDMKDYINVSGGGIALTRNVPTGLEMAYSRHRSFQDGGSNYSAFDFGINLVKPEWEVTLLVYQLKNGGEDAIGDIRRQFGLDFNDALDLHRTLRGFTFTITEVSPVPPDSKIPWTPENIQILMNMVLIKRDIEAFRTGGIPKPDRAVFAPANLPKHFHAALSNIVPEPRS
jgi:hypothetical protein